MEEAKILKKGDMNMDRALGFQEGMLGLVLGLAVGFIYIWTKIFQRLGYNSTIAIDYKFFWMTEQGVVS